MAEPFSGAFQSNYDKEPCISIRDSSHRAWEAYGPIGRELEARARDLGKPRVIITLECYPSVRLDEIVQGLGASMKFQGVFYSDEAALEGGAITAKMAPFLTEDRIFGYRYPFKVADFFVPQKIEEMRRQIEQTEGILLLIGFGASLIHRGDILVYGNLARWEIQQRFRRGELGNWKAQNEAEDPLRKYKRGFFIEWPMADRLKKGLYDSIDYLLDTIKKDEPKMIRGEAYRQGLEQVVSAPFRTVPYFDPGVWGGQWMKKTFALNPKADNYAWSFDGVPEENSLYLLYGETRIEVPAQDAVLYRPLELLGEEVYGRFGAEFPIRFDFLDTMGGGNLSLQVHPLTAYIQEQFGMPYTQEESYYILDAEEGAVVYLGVKEGTDPQEMLKALREAQGDRPFEAEKYINTFPAKKHDHFSIPPGTIHCSGTNSVVLEISATPFNFTFKLWDWGRLGLDGKPRPINIDHGEKVIAWDRDSAWVKANLINPLAPIAQGDHWREERTGLHPSQFIETRRMWTKGPVTWNTHGTFNMLNLVSGREALIESPSASFEPFILHYAETVIIPASVGEYRIRPHGESEGQEIALIKAYVRSKG